MANRPTWQLGLALVVSALGLTFTEAAEGPLQFNGRPFFREGWERGYYVWRDGRRWHVRWTTMGQMRRFSGAVAAEGGELDDLKRVDVESERKVIRSGRPARVVRGPRGRVQVKPGRAPVVATREQDRIERDGDRRIVFVAHTDDDIDGFDFEVSDEVRSLRFNLEIDGQSRAGDVEAGGKNRRVDGNPFVVHLK